jgi:hypothetical protein
MRNRHCPANPTAMQPLLRLVALALLATGVSACGRTSTHARSASHTTPTIRASSSNEAAPLLLRADRDRDNDIEAPDDDKNNNRDLNFGHAASTTEIQAITALVKRYYAAALADDGASACSMIYSTLAEAIPEDYGQPPGPRYMRGAKTCQAAMTLFFNYYHAQLAAEVPKLQVTRVRLIEHHGYALLRFGALPERKIAVGQEGHTWRLQGLLDIELA